MKLPSGICLFYRILQSHIIVRNHVLFPAGTGIHFTLGEVYYIHYYLIVTI